MRLPTLLLLGILILATTQVLMDRTANIIGRMDWRTPIETTDGTSFNVRTSTLGNRMASYQMMTHNEEARIHGGGIVPFTHIECMGTLPGKIRKIDTIMTHYGHRFLLVGPDFITINGTNYTYRTSFELPECGYDVGDLDMDGFDEVVIIEGDYLVVLDDRLNVIWKRWLGGFAGEVDSVFIANFTSPDYSLIVTYKYGGLYLR